MLLSGSRPRRAGVHHAGDHRPLRERALEIVTLETRGDFTGAVAAWEAVAVAEPGNPWPLVRSAELHRARTRRSRCRPRALPPRARAAGGEAGTAAIREPADHRPPARPARTTEGRAMVELRMLIDRYPRSREAEGAREALRNLKAGNGITLTRRGCVICGWSGSADADDLPHAPLHAGAARAPLRNRARRHRRLRVNKLRSLLTMLGIIIGVGAVIAMIALGNGAQQSVQDRIASLGTTLLQVNPQRVMQAGIQTQALRKLTPDDARMIADRSRHLAEVQPRAGRQSADRVPAAERERAGHRHDAELPRRPQVRAGRRGGCSPRKEDNARLRVAVRRRGRRSRSWASTDAGEHARRGHPHRRRAVSRRRACSSPRARRTRSAIPTRSC